MTDNSVKLRMLITLYALYRYADKNHRMNSTRLNEFLRPYGMESGYRVISDTVNVLQEFGVKIAKNSDQYNTNVWIEDRPLSEHVLKKLIFAVRTNPHLTQEQADEILESIKPALTVYQEPLLESEFKDLSRPSEIDKYHICSVIQDAIRSGKAVLYYGKGKKPISFIPERLFQQGEHIYVQGHTRAKSDEVCIGIDEMSMVKLGCKSRKNCKEQ